MGKKPEVGEEVATKSPGEIIGALTEANKAMKVAYDAGYAQRLQLVRENEAMERESLAVEVEIKGLEDQEEDLGNTDARLAKRREGLKDTVDKLTQERDILAAENKEMSQLQKQLDEEVTRLRKLQEDYVQAVGKFRQARRRITGE